jgi:hypothetical protein
LIDLPQLIVPAWLFNAAISGLVCATTWHVLTIVAQLRKQARSSEE